MVHSLFDLISLSIEGGDNGIATHGAGALADVRKHNRLPNVARGGLRTAKSYGIRVDSFGDHNLSGFYEAAMAEFLLGPSAWPGWMDASANCDSSTSLYFSEDGAPRPPSLSFVPR
jgi:hypothetical protein